MSPEQSWKTPVNYRGSACCQGARPGKGNSGLIWPLERSVVSAVTKGFGIGKLWRHINGRRSERTYSWVGKLFRASRKWGWGQGPGDGGSGRLGRSSSTKQRVQAYSHPKVMKSYGNIFNRGVTRSPLPLNRPLICE